MVCRLGEQELMVVERVPESKRWGAQEGRRRARAADFVNCLEFTVTGCGSLVQGCGSLAHKPTLGE